MSPAEVLKKKELKLLNDIRHVTYYASSRSPEEEGTETSSSTAPCRTLCPAEVLKKKELKHFSSAGVDPEVRPAEVLKKKELKPERPVATTAAPGPAEVLKKKELKLRCPTYSTHSRVRPKS